MHPTEFETLLLSQLPKDIVSVIMCFVEYPICSICGFGYVNGTDDDYIDDFVECNGCLQDVCRFDCSVIDSDEMAY